MFLFPQERGTGYIKDIRIAQWGPSEKHRKQHTIIVSSKCGKLGTLQHLEIIAPSAFLLPEIGFNVILCQFVIET